ncbi:kinesin-like protein KIF16B isoform C [Alligator mississippiensis]|uniref:Kinesin-like protein KIF16B isoform C n=1 Tax=Alligator mississippiensis TaxID=8496 RepID=A0A151MVG4_ALLMI|nr:kinesin-like protein KIF16B isoform C [Alligator mississippiensis]
MMGTPASIGLTPRICEGLFSREDDYSEQPASCRVEVSFLEIYNERVRDLLKQSDHKKPYTLRVREHPETGPYVQGLSQHLVTDYKQVVGLLEEGIAKRITAATHIHDASSRSHAIFTIHYTQAILENNLPSEIASKINLVDLAGSERADPSYCKDRITEGANINKSLVTLGIVISTLAQNSQMFSSCQSINSITSEGDSSPVGSHTTGSVSGTRRQAYIPYRDSILTWLLKDSLGGNSKTIMVATISPASSSYNETMSTLRYASNAKNIINKPRVNEDANVKLIRELREEIDRLKTMLISFELRNSSPSWSDDRDGNLTELVLQNEMKIDQLTKDWTSKWTDRKAIMEEYSVDINKEKVGVTIDSNLPHLMAMDDDILSTGVVLYHLREGTTKIGRIDSDQEQDIVLQGQWIEREHCIISNNCGIVTLQPVQGAHCTVNGQEVTTACRLSQGALVVLGKVHKFRFNHPAEAAILRQRRSISEGSPILSHGALDWLNLDRDFISSSTYIFSPLEKESQECLGHEQHQCSAEVSRERDSVHEEYEQKLREQEAFHREKIQRQQLFVEDLKQQILSGQIKAERELENDQALINHQIRENQQWLIKEHNQLAALQQQQREFAVQTESKSYAEAEVQNTVELEICPSLVEQNQKRLVQLELLQKYSLKKAERNIRRKKVKFQLEKIVKKQKLLEAKRKLEQLEASCWLSEDNLKQTQTLNQNAAITPWHHKLQRRNKSLGSSSLPQIRYSFCNCHPPHIRNSLLKKETTSESSELSTSPNTCQEDELRYLNVNFKGKNTEFSTAKTYDVRGASTVQSNSGAFGHGTTKSNLFQSVFVSEKYNEQCQGFTTVNESWNSASNLNIEPNVKQSCSGINSNCSCPKCYLQCQEQKNKVHKEAEISLGFEVDIFSDMPIQNKSLCESKEEKEAAFFCKDPNESNRSGEVLLFGGSNNYMKTDAREVYEYNTTRSASAFEEGSPYSNKESECLKKEVTAESQVIPKETTVPHQSKQINKNEEIPKLINSVVKPEGSILDMKSRQREKLSNYSVVETQSDIVDRSCNLESSSLDQRPKDPNELVVCKDHYEIDKELYIPVLHEEPEKASSGVTVAEVRYTHELEAVVGSESCLQTSTFHQNQRKENMEISILLPVTDVVSEITSSPECSSSTNLTQNTIDFLDANEDLMRINRMIENVLNTDKIATAKPTEGSQEKSLEDDGKEQKIISSNKSEVCTAGCLMLAHENFSQENKVDGSRINSEVTESEEQVNVKVNEGFISRRRGELHAGKNIALFIEETPSLGKKYHNEEIINEHEIPEIYLTASTPEEHDAFTVDNSNSIEIKKNSGFPDLCISMGIMNTLMKDVNECDSSADDSALTEQHRSREESKGLVIKENSNTLMSSCTEYPENDASENLDTDTVGSSSDIVYTDPVHSIVHEKEKAHLINLVVEAKIDVLKENVKSCKVPVFRTDRERKTFTDNTEELELTTAHNQNELSPEDKGNCHLSNDDSKLNKILKESQCLFKDFAKNNDTSGSSVPSDQQSIPVTVKSSEEIQQCSLEVFPCPSVNDLLYLGINNSAECAQIDPTVLKENAKPVYSNAGSGVILPYYETLMGSDMHDETPSTPNRQCIDESFSDKMQDEESIFQQTMLMEERWRKLFALKSISNCAAPGHFGKDDMHSSAYTSDCCNSVAGAVSQDVKHNSFFLERLDSSETIIQNVSNSHGVHRMGFSVGKQSKDCLYFSENATQGKDVVESRPVVDSPSSENSNLLISTVLKDQGEKMKQYSPEASLQATSDDINLSQKELHPLAQCDPTEECAVANCIKTGCKGLCERLPDVFTYQTEHKEIQTYKTPIELFVGYPDISAFASENALTLLERSIQPPWKTAACAEDSPRYNINPYNSKTSTSLLNSPDLVESIEDKIDAICFEKAKYFKNESADLGVPLCFSDDLPTSQTEDEGKHCSTSRQNTDMQHVELTQEVVGTDQVEEQNQDSFLNCHDKKENMKSSQSEDSGSSSSMKVPEINCLKYQSLEQMSSKETKPLPFCSVEDFSICTVYPSYNSLSTFDTSNSAEDSKPLTFNQLEDSLQDTYLTDQLSSTAAEPHSVQEEKERAFLQGFPKACYSSLKMFSKYPLTSDIGYNETSRSDDSHTATSNCSTFAKIQMQESQSDDSVVFDQQSSTSENITYSPAKENRHVPMSHTESTSDADPSADRKSINKNNSKLNNVQERWDKIPPQKGLENLEKVHNDNVSMPSLSPFWDSARATLNRDANIRQTPSRNERELHSNTEKEVSVTERKQRKIFLRKDHMENQTRASSISADNFVDPQIAASQNLSLGDADVDSMYMCNLYWPVCPTDNEDAYTDLQDNWQPVRASEDDQGRPNISGGKDLIHSKNNTSLSFESHTNNADYNPPVANETLKSERLKVSGMNSENTSFRVLPEDNCLPPQESTLMLLRSKKSCFATQTTKTNKQEEQKSCLHHRLSAPAIAVISDLEYSSEASTKTDLSLYPASKSLQELNMSVEPPSPTDDDLHGIERFSKQASDNFMQAKYKSRFQQRSVQTKRFANYDPKNLQNYGERTQRSHSRDPSLVHCPPALAHISDNSIDTDANNTSVAQCSEGEELRDQSEETDLFLPDNKDTMHFSSSDINPYIHPWQQDGPGKIGWKQYVFGSASDVSCNQPPLTLDNHKVMRCSSVDNGLNSHNSPFHSHLSSYATAKVLSSTLSSAEDLQGWDDMRRDFESTYSSDSTKHYGEEEALLEELDMEKTLEMPIYL